MKHRGGTDRRTNQTSPHDTMLKNHSPSYSYWRAVLWFVRMNNVSHGRKHANPRKSKGIKVTAFLQWGDSAKHRATTLPWSHIWECTICMKFPHSKCFFMLWWNAQSGCRADFECYKSTDTQQWVRYIFKWLHLYRVCAALAAGGSWAADHLQ